MEFSRTTWLISVAAVLVSALLAWRRGDLRRRLELDMGFANHGGMWGDLLLLPVANAVIVPHLTSGLWIAPSVALGSALSMRVHVHWYRGERDVEGRPLDSARDRQSIDAAGGQQSTVASTCGHRVAADRGGGICRGRGGRTSRTWLASSRC